MLPCTHLATFVAFFAIYVATICSASRIKNTNAKAAADSHAIEERSEQFHFSFTHYNHKLQRRGSAYIGADGYLTPGRPQAQVFFITRSGELRTANNDFVTADPSDDNLPFASSATRQSISSTWSRSRGVPVWTNSSFPGGKTTFCLGSNNRVYIVIRQAPSQCQLVTPAAVPTASTLPSISSTTVQVSSSIQPTAGTTSQSQSFGSSQAFSITGSSISLVTSSTSPSSIIPGSSTQILTSTTVSSSVVSNPSSSISSSTKPSSTNLFSGGEFSTGSAMTVASSSATISTLTSVYSNSGSLVSSSDTSTTSGLLSTGGPALSSSTNSNTLLVSSSTAQTIVAASSTSSSTSIGGTLSSILGSTSTQASITATTSASSTTSSTRGTSTATGTSSSSLASSTQPASSTFVSSSTLLTTTTSPSSTLLSTTTVLTTSSTSTTAPAYCQTAGASPYRASNNAVLIPNCNSSYDTNSVAGNAVGVASFVTCMEFCAQSAGISSQCVGFNFDPSIDPNQNSNCFLLLSLDGNVTSVSSLGLQSGAVIVAPRTNPNSVPDSDTSYTTCPDDNGYDYISPNAYYSLRCTQNYFDFTQSPVFTNTATSFTNCAGFCDTNSLCQGYVYNSGNGSCIGYRSPTYIAGNLNVTTGILENIA